MYRVYRLVGARPRRELATLTEESIEDCVNDTMPFTVDPLADYRIHVAFLEKWGSDSAADSCSWMAECAKITPAKPNLLNMGFDLYCLWV